MGILKTIVLGFIAGAIATLTVHEFVSWIFNNPAVWTGWPRTSWSKEPFEVAGLGIQIPVLFNAMFWGGVWGSVIALILGARPQGSTTLKGALLGLLGPALIGLFVLVPVLKGLPLFFGGDSAKIIPALCILTAYGAATAWLYGAFRYHRLP
jgi:hypothetical protein